MKKDIEWAKRQVADREFNSDGGELHLDVIRTSHVYKILNQLDEPKTLSQEWIDEYQGEVLDEDEGIRFNAVSADDLQNLIVPEQEITKQQVDEYLCKENLTAVNTDYLRVLVEEEDTDPETVASVLTDLWNSFERFKEIMNMEVGELEE